mmetsp:Transcript_26906/g.46361  ORF Transcript_26906/g.46361 Transcript_26906/m.46361 type:complete len:334 (+) Transcript_26906:145-1146(+)
MKKTKKTNPQTFLGCQSFRLPLYTTVIPRSRYARALILAVSKTKRNLTFRPLGRNSRRLGCNNRPLGRNNFTKSDIPQPFFLTEPQQRICIDHGNKVFPRKTGRLGDKRREETGSVCFKCVRVGLQPQQLYGLSVHVERPRRRDVCEPHRRVGALLWRQLGVGAGHIGPYPARAAGINDELRVVPSHESGQGRHADLRHPIRGVDPPLLVVTSARRLADELVHQRRELVDGQVVAEDLVLQGLAQSAEHGGVGRHVDHMSAGAEEGQEAPIHGQGAEVVYVDGLAGLLAERLLRGDFEGEASVVQKDVHVAEHPLHVLGGSSQPFGVVQVEGH